MKAIDTSSQAQLFTEARSFSHWQDSEVSEAQLKAVYDLVRMGPTSANCCPARFVFVTSDAGKARLRPHLIESNVEKTMSAPATVIVAHDMEFYEQVPKLFPHNPGAREWFTGSPEATRENAVRNGTLQGGYLIMAARALGLDCGPMSGFDPDGVNEEFFAGTAWRVNFLCNLGIGDRGSLHARCPRLEFDEACKIV